MVHETADRKINTDAKIENDDIKRMPHERDESPDGQDADPRGIMKQAASDVAEGLVDTDLHGKPGAAADIDTGAAATPGSGQAKPQDDAADSMRFTTDSTKTKGNNK